jgi:hypothetical protein
MDVGNVLSFKPWRPYPDCIVTMRMRWANCIRDSTLQAIRWVFGSGVHKLAIFRCSHTTCHYYRQNVINATGKKLVKNWDQVEKAEQQIQDIGSHLCPVWAVQHGSTPDLQVVIHSFSCKSIYFSFIFAVNRLCPIQWHLKCLPNAVCYLTSYNRLYILSNCLKVW